ncbi:MAG: YggS family pyridoxal phosphate-dependent enzyme [Myxococcales bacterium]|nr:MAG: YggS family pyridoxal phosphate-dependent enzyme [Myxococcales bacterium]
MAIGTRIEQRLQTIQGRMDEACLRRKASWPKPKLLAVSKKQSSAAIREAYALGLREFGENYVQELQGKAEEFADLPELRFHLIGHLQRNKTKQALACSSVVQSVDSLGLLQRLAGQHEAATPLDIFIQVNLAGESQKSGCDPNELEALVDEAKKHKSIRLLGLMMVPPFGEAEKNRLLFRQLRRLADHYGLEDCSMGMSDDFEVAIEEGATLVRIGTALFGPRQHK